MRRPEEPDRQAPPWHVYGSFDPCHHPTGPADVVHHLQTMGAAGHLKVPLYGRGPQPAATALDGCQQAARGGHPVFVLDTDGWAKSRERTVGNDGSRTSWPLGQFWALLVHLYPVRWKPVDMFAHGIAGPEYAVDLPDDAPLVVENVDGRGGSLLVYGAHSIRMEPLTPSTSR